MVGFTKSIAAAVLGATLLDASYALPVQPFVDLTSGQPSSIQADFQKTQQPAVVAGSKFTKPRVGISLKEPAARSFATDSAARTITVPLERREVAKDADPLLALRRQQARAERKLAKRAKLKSEPAHEVPLLAGTSVGLETVKDSDGVARLSRRAQSNNVHGRIGIVLKATNADEVFLQQLQGKLPVKRALTQPVVTLPQGVLSTASPLSGLPLPATGAASVIDTPGIATLSTASSNSTLVADVDGSSSSSSSVATPYTLASTTTSASSGHSNTAIKGYSPLDLKVAISGALTNATKPKVENSIGLDIEANDVGYVATIQLGSQKKPFRMLIDSGSADTWVPSEACTTCGKTHHTLGPKVSKTFKPFKNSKFSITYGTGAVKGTLAADSMTIAGMTLKNQTMGLATQTTTDFSAASVPFDGLMGLAKMELSNAQTPTPIDSLYAEGLVSAPVMGYKLGRVANGKNNDGQVTFGGVDAQKFVGNLVEVPNVSVQGFWEAPVDKIKFGGKDLSMPGRYAILDTGTSLMIAPKADADRIHAAIPGAKSDGQGGYTIPCTTTGVLSFTFGGKEFEIDPRDMTFLPVDQNNLTGDCISSLSAGSVGQANEWLVGAAFLKNVYFATNAIDNVIGLGKLR